MAKKIRFPLEMDNGVEVRGMEELREHFSLAKVLECLENGRLVTWLRDHYANDIADAVEALDQNDSELAKKVSEIFDVPYDEEALEKSKERAQRLKRLKEFTQEEQFLDKIDNVAFDQDELYDLLDEDKESIYLCGDRFTIPLSKARVSYVGINNPTAVIDSKVEVDWEEKNISIEGVTFDEKYQDIVYRANAAREEGERSTKEESWKLEVLKEHGIEEWQIDSVAFNQEELNEQLGRYKRYIYLYGERFSIPLNQEYMNHVRDDCRNRWGTLVTGYLVNFIGINNPTIVIESSLYDFLGNEEVSFENIEFADDNYRKANLVKEALSSPLDFIKEKRNGLSMHKIFNSTAFNQADLSRLLHEGVNPIYLIGKEPFYISVDKKNMKYIGLNPASEDNPNVIIDTKEYVNLGEKGIKLISVNIDEAFQKLLEMDPERELDFLAVIFEE